MNILYSCQIPGDPFLSLHTDKSKMKKIPIALTRSVSPSIVNCELTHIDRTPIDLDRAVEQHHQYEQALRKMGYHIRRLPDTPHLPDSVFVEDVALVFKEMGVITRPGAASRIAETESMAPILSEYREIAAIQSPGTLDGGDVLIIGKKVYVGESTRSNREGISQLKQMIEPFGYDLITVKTDRCLHLKTGISVLENDLLLINPEWIPDGLFRDYNTIPVHHKEPYGANVMRYKNYSLCPTVFKYTADILYKLGYDVIQIDQSELAKAEAGLTCCSVIVE